MDRGAEQRGYKKRKTFRTMLMTQRTDLTVMMFTTFNARCMKVYRGWIQKNYLYNLAVFQHNSSAVNLISKKLTRPAFVKTVKGMV